MFDVPARYVMNSPIHPKTFILREMKKSDKERIRQNLLSVLLLWQIVGEGIPSRVDEDYNCSVIVGLECALKNVRNPAFFAEHIQSLVKAPCVIRFYDQESEIYSFAHKRLNRNDHTQVVVADRVQTQAMPLVFPDKTAMQYRRYLSFDELKNKTDKLNLYLEAMVKTSIISNLQMCSDMLPLLDDKIIWYNPSKFMALFETIKKIVLLSKELKNTYLPAEKAKLIGEIRALQSVISAYKGDE